MKAFPSSQAKAWEYLYIGFASGQWKRLDFVTDISKSR
jgi:hypothetical protein